MSQPAQGSAFAGINGMAYGFAADVMIAETLAAVTQATAGERLKWVQSKH